MHNSTAAIILVGCIGANTLGCGNPEDSKPSNPSTSTANRQTTATPNGTLDFPPGEVLIISPLAPPATADLGVPLFTSVPPEASGVEFKMVLSDPLKHIREYTFLSPFGGVCTGDFDGDGKPDFYVSSARGSGRLFRNLGNFRFEDVTKSAGVFDENYWGTGAAMADVNNDGALDLFLCGYNNPNRCFINQGAGDDGITTFVDDAKRLGLAFNGASMTMAFADIDNDGDLDGYLATTAKAPPPGTKFQVRFVAGKPYVLDELKEYWELIYLPGERVHRTEAGQYDRLFRNDGDRFTEITKQAGIDGPYFTLAATWWDYNQDGLPDVYVSNDYSGPDFLYRNNGDGTFANVAPEVLPHSAWFSMGSDIADFNNDGLIDFFATDMSARTNYRVKVMHGNVASSTPVLEVIKPRQYMRNALYLNAGGGRVKEAARLARLSSTDWTWNPRFADFDNDGDVDAYITNGILRDMMDADLSRQAEAQFEPNSAEWVKFWATRPFRKEPNAAFRNDGEMRFVDVSEEWGLLRNGVSFGASTADFDGDGDLDIVVNNADTPVGLYHNNSQTGSRAVIRLVGTQSNRFGLGASIMIDAAGKRQTQYMTVARGWLSAVAPEAHFGLGDAESIDELSIRWPSGAIQVFRDLDVNVHLTIREQMAEVYEAQQPSSYFDQIPQLSAFEFATIEHQEQPFNDFLFQPLLPYKLSQFGPIMAWGDVDRDGDQDCYLGSSVGTSGQLLINDGSGKFEIRRIEAFHTDRDSEDGAALFFDADGDQDLDLYVASGSNEYKIGAEEYRDRLYINDGSGNYAAAPEAIPDHRDSGGAVAAADFDRDGDLDLFVGSRCMPREYPRTPTSRLLRNDDGRFVDVADERLSQAGMATGAVWQDVDGDEWPDLLVTIDRGPVRFFANRKGQLSERTEEAGLSNLRGWWQAIATADLDQDGDADFVVTNLGLNTPYLADENAPEVILYGDFDGTGRRRIIEAVYDNDKLVPRRGLSAFQQTAPVMVQAFSSFDHFAKVSIDDWFPPSTLREAVQLKSTILESGVLFNNGDGTLRLEPLPYQVQAAPCRGIAIADFNEDGLPDVAVAQNFYGPNIEVGKMNGGTSLVLLNKSDGKFEVLSTAKSGVHVDGDASAVSAVDLDGDQKPDLVFAVNDGPLVGYRLRTEEAAREDR